MPRRCPPFVELWRDRHSKVRCYFRKERGPRFALPSTVGSDEFKAAYEAALAGQLAAVRERHSRAAAGTINALVISYKQSVAYKYKQSVAYKGLRETLASGMDSP